MSSAPRTIHIGRLSLEYFCFGSGETTVICLHGHGRPASDFEFVASEERRVISLHLFHHGNSRFPENEIEENPLKIEEFTEVFEQLLEVEDVERFHLFAFSQGGRFSLCILPFFAEKIETVTLISPDGMDNWSFYNWSSRQKWARRVFQRLEKHPEKVAKYSSIANKMKLMRPKVRAFVDEFSSDEERFKRASQTWRNFRMLRPDIAKIKKVLRDHPVTFLIIMGSYDQVIRPKQAYRFARKIGQPDCVKEIPNGHHFFKPSSINKFLHLLPFGQQ
jgi:pimeloyl-ACP methyl ester carboxylesterase